MGHHSLLFLVFILISFVNSQFINCTNEHTFTSNFVSACSSQTFNCTDRDTPCTIICNGYQSCFNIKVNNYVGAEVSLQCNGSYSCYSSTISNMNSGTKKTLINCIGEVSCAEMTIDGTFYGDVSMNCNDENSCRQIDLLCGSTSQCDVQCNSRYACRRANINGNIGTKLSINCNDFQSCDALTAACSSNQLCYVQCLGQQACIFAEIQGGIGSNLTVLAEGKQSLYAAIVECPMESLPGSAYANDRACKVNINGTNAMGAITIKSTSWNGIELVCITPPCSNYYGNDDEYNGPKLLCLDSLDNECHFQPISNDKWRCIDAGNLCDVQSTPPPVQLPTFAPTYDRNVDPPHTLYVSASNGCDYGWCQTNEFKKSDFCAFEENVCCDGQTTSAPTSSPTLAEMSSSLCDKSNTVLISNYTLYNNSVFGNVYDNINHFENKTEGYKVVCFDVVSDFTCWSPTVRGVQFESITYTGVDDSFSVAYKNKDNIINSERCRYLSNNCGVFNECPILGSLNEVAWSAQNGPHLFYFLNGKNVPPNCDNPTRSLNARIEVECNRLQTQCQSFEYAWKCMHGIGEDCADSEYNRNGKIVMDEGQYFMNYSMGINFDYIIVEGNGKNKTEFIHSADHEFALIYCARFCNLTFSNLSYSITGFTESSFILVEDNGILRFDSVYFENNDVINFAVFNNASIEFIDCEFMSSTIRWSVSKGANAYFDNCLFHNLKAENSDDSLIVIGDNSNVLIESCTFSNIQSKLIWKSVDSVGKIMNTVNDCNGVCFEHMNGNLFIDYQSAYNKSVKFGVSNATASSPTTNLIPSKSYDAQPTFAPTLSPVTKYVLQATNFDPAKIYDDVVFDNFDDTNGEIIFEPCTIFNSEYMEQTLFEQKLTGMAPTHLFNQSADLFDEYLFCNQSDICWVKCHESVLVCPQSVFESNGTETALFECLSESACHQSEINVSNANSAFILCNDVTSCEEMMIMVTDSNVFSLECVQKESCKDVIVNIAQTNNAQIHCYGKNACDGIKIYSDNNKIKVNVHSFSSNVGVNVPTNYSEDALNCNPNNAYLRLDGMTFNNLESATKQLFDANMPCEDVKFSVSKSDKVECQIRYEHYSNYQINQRLKYLTNQMQCFPPIYIANLTKYDCFGTDAPTQSPTSAPTTFCSEISVNLNDNFEGFDKYFDGMFVYDGTENDMPYWSTPQKDNNKSVKYVEYNKWRINGAERGYFMDIEDSNFLQLISSVTPMSGKYSKNYKYYSITIKCVLTASPTSSPSISPSPAPSMSPTKHPTVQPTNEPTTQPTFAPTTSPSRAPTSLSDYDSFISLDFSIRRIDWREVTLLAEKNGKYKFNETMNVDIVNMIESAYVSLDWTLHFNEFYVRIETVNDLIISDLAKEERPDITLTNDCWQRKHSCNLTLKSKLVCSEAICDYIYEKFPSQILQFEKIMTVDFFEYLYPQKNASENDKIYFAVENMAEPRLINPPKTKWHSKLVNWIIIFVGIVIIIMIVMFFYLKHSMKSMRKKKAFVVRNPMVLLISIGKYIGNKIHDLPGIENDILHMTELFGGRLGYDVYPKAKDNEVRIEWREKDFKEFIEERSKYLADNIDDGKKYDSLILVISCHGIPDYLLMSDYRKYSKLAVQRTFSLSPKLREIPRFILFDCCSGHQGRKLSVKPVSSTTGVVGEKKLKTIEEKDIFDGIEDQNLWCDEDQNPDHLLARVNAANAGFTSNLNSMTGSYLIYKMFNKYMDALDGKRSPFPFIHEVFDEIQTELQEEGKQLPESVWNDNTRYLVFKKPNGAISKQTSISAHTYERFDDDDCALEMAETEKKKAKVALDDSISKKVDDDVIIYEDGNKVNL